MKQSLFFRMGKFIYNHATVIILLWIILFLSCTPFISDIITPFKATGFTVSHSASEKAKEFLNQRIGYNKNQIIILYTSEKKINTAELSAIKKSLSRLKKFPLEHLIIYPTLDKQISKNKHTAYAVIFFKTDDPIGQKHLMALKKAIQKPPKMTVDWGGEAFFMDMLNKETQQDLFNADIVAAPLTIVALIFIFGSLIAAILPILLGGGCALIILTTLYLLGHAFTLSIFTLNIALLLGLCLSLDYSLFIISRFREELNHHKTAGEALAITQATAGKAVFFSGLAVFVSLSALLLFPINILFSVGIGGLAAVLYAVAIAIILLPAILSLLKQRINLFAVRSLKTKPAYFWGWVASKVVRRPTAFFIILLTFLLLLGYPFLEARFGISDHRILPKESEGRHFFTQYEKSFNGNDLEPVILVITAKSGHILSKYNIGYLYNFSQRIKKNPLVDEVYSIVNIDKKLNKSQYQQLYNNPTKSDDIKKLLKTTTSKKTTLFKVIGTPSSNSPETATLIKELKATPAGQNLHVQITGTRVDNTDVLQTIKTIFPYAIVWIMVLTYIILLILLRSIFLPFKALLMNIVSLCASYGVLVFIFQEGHFHQLLNFDPQGMLDISLLIIIFCALFGFSMDYEVFLLTRIKECYEKIKDHEKSIIFGINQSSKIITSAAIIVIFICGSFMVANVLMVKEFGLGVAVAIAVDAFLIRNILVPATMVLLKQWNWYLPRWLGKILPRWE